MVNIMAETIKVSEIAKNFKTTSKDVISKLKELGIEVKSPSSSITDEQAGMVMDVFLRMEEYTHDELISMRDEALNPSKEKSSKKGDEVKDEKAKVEKVKEKKKSAKAEENKKQPEEQVVKPAEKKAEEKSEKKPEEKVKEKPEEKTEEINKNETQPQEKKEKTTAQEPKDEQKKNNKNNKKKQHNAAKKQGGKKIDMNYADNANAGEEFVVKAKERKRYVDTRQSTVEIDTIEKRERIEDLVPENIKMERGRKQKNKKNLKQQQQMPKEESKRHERRVEKKAKAITEVEIPELITVGDFAQKIGKPGAEIVKKLMMLGVMATLNQSIDFETAQLIGEEFGITVNQEIVLTKEDLLLGELDTEDKEEDLKERPPVVVVMGHVDHGKTSLLDAIRHTSVTDTEAGGITQHIGAYNVKLNDRIITFLDTPGHEAFTTMRARGAQVTDIAILVVAADDGVMPQTIEAINHAKAAGVQIIVAINKIDKEGANPDRVKQMLVEYELIPEEWGGDTVCVEISAKKNMNIDGLLEMVLLVADMQELKANPNRSAKGTVIEAQIDKGRGPVATVLVQNGTLKVGDVVIAGTAVGRVRAMVNDKGRRVKVAGPSMPVEILGLGEAPSGGDQFYVVENEKLAREVAAQRKQEIQENKFSQFTKVSLDNLFSQIDEGNMKELDVIIKADVQGSVEAVKQSLEKLSNDEVRVRAIHGGVGAINESDVMLANASNAIIVGFNVRPDAGAVSAAEQQEVDIRLYRVIYQAIEEIEAAMKGMLDPEFKEVVLGYAEVRQTFKVSGVGTIAGCYVTQGKIQRNAGIRLVRDGVIIHEGEISSLRRFKDDAKEVSENFECGIGIEGFNDIKEGDTMECFVMEEIER